MKNKASSSNLQWLKKSESAFLHEGSKSLKLCCPVQRPLAMWDYLIKITF